MSFDAARMVKDFEKTSSDVSVIKQKLNGIHGKLNTMKTNIETASKRTSSVSDKQRISHIQDIIRKHLKAVTDATPAAETAGKGL
ncbi:hypothetical protein Pmar_PMAR003413 [Perkinsus marinus ATCC 50983]|uniref:Uncharacterized protein n=1 Tax=Perkinsus marinus (strain ATCC 50983 / TXsc) TaxID=423536 RepID=C5KH93_PERM5|nr:hypothetical protein Pmar_PMAR003413 [Perkinsus marinus ATCC 50983]EER15955.1 hypothetical protein Pmar_PMAR003413 [Perkinsus marinus ATCC 50983]|eukprot:XP_002784159.1 hypothetical protein Pmar_PMAR003413 [Perkinsus marinus ATCC 50983]